MGDVLAYARDQNDWETERQAYHVLYPQVGAETASIAGPVMPVWWAMPILGVGGAAAGHVTGRMVAAHRAMQIEAAVPSESPTGEEATADDSDLLPPGGVVLTGPADAP